MGRELKSFFRLAFSGIPAGWLPLEEGFPSLDFPGILPEGLSGPAPTGGLLSCANKKVTKEIARGPLPAPWTPGAVVPDLRPLYAFSLEPSSGLSAAWVHTRRPPPFGCWNWEGCGNGGVPPPGVFRHPAGGVVGSRPDRRVTFLCKQESNQRNCQGASAGPLDPRRCRSRLAAALCLQFRA